MENSDGKKPLSALDKNNVTFLTVIDNILEKYKYHPSVSNIRKNSELKCFETTTGVLKLIKRINISEVL